MIGFYCLNEPCRVARYYDPAHGVHFYVRIDSLGHVIEGPQREAFLCEGLRETRFT